MDAQLLPALKWELEHRGFAQSEAGLYNHCVHFLSLHHKLPAV